ncbi:MAG: hypothetical protein Ct9H300mP28_28060 [Pseudomonadota bacterium]|nr:MAG: hypothetical protein Ct9H300mP28_28060 [Pseudomonadota bacterium]
MNKKQFIEELNLEGQRVLTRVDFNVPLNDELNITDNGRIKAAFLQYLTLLRMVVRLFLCRILETWR